MVTSVAFAGVREQYESAIDAYNSGQHEQAMSIYGQMIKDYPQFAPAYIGYGLALKVSGGDIEEVVYYYKTAVDKDPSNVQSLEQLGRLYYSIGQMKKARPVLEKALSIDPNLTSVKQILGWIHLVGKNANPSMAIRYFKEVLKVQENANVSFGLGIAYFSDNQREKVLDIITYLKEKGEQDYAGRLEKALRENHKVVLDMPTDESDDPTQASEGDDFEKTADSPAGMKVRLRGKLDEL